MRNLTVKGCTEIDGMMARKQTGSWHFLTFQCNIGKIMASLFGQNERKDK